MLSVIVAVIGAGCSDPSHKQALGERLSGMENTCRVAQQHEAQRCGSLQETLNLAAREHKEDVDRTARAPGTINELIREDIQHWQDREPYRKRVMQEELGGKPANIEHTVPRIIY